MARSPTLTALLGDSDLVAALNHLLRSVMEYAATTDDPLAVTAAAYSLGLARELDSRADIHIVIGLSPESIALTIDTQVRTATPMRTPRLGLSRDDEPMQQVELEFGATQRPTRTRPTCAGG